MSRTYARTILAALVFALGCLAPTVSQASWLVGLDEVQLSGAKYTFNDNLTNPSNSGSMVGTDLVLEWLPSNRFGIEADYGVLPLERRYQLGTAGAISNNVTERATPALLGANLYLTPNDKPGIHPTFGVAYGQLDVRQQFDGGTLGHLVTHNTVPINVLKLGLEWVFGSAVFGGGPSSFGVLRLQYQAWTGGRVNTSAITGVRQELDYNSSAIVLGAAASF
ncbi:MAG: hypothetical protein ACHQZQ_05145 [SAR324 cluster bacterium]